MSLLTNEMKEVIEELLLFEDWEDKYTYIIECGKKLEKLDNKYKTDYNLVVGCASQVWLIIYKDSSINIFFLQIAMLILLKG